MLLICQHHVTASCWISCPAGWVSGGVELHPTAKERIVEDRAIAGTSLQSDFGVSRSGLSSFSVTSNGEIMIRAPSPPQPSYAVDAR
jgi:hypothetical protein